jgi:PTS system galactitol-specific IIC component
MNFQPLIDALNYFLELGVPIVTPLLLFALSLIFRVPLGRAVRSAVTYGVGFVGIFIVLDLLLGALSSVAQLLIENAGLEMEIMDVGWPVLAAVAFGVPTFVTVFLGVLITNLIMFSRKLTKTLDIDFHNYYHWVLPATVVYFATGSLLVGTIVGIANAIITLKLADWTAKYVEEWWDLPGISVPHMSTVGWFPFCYAVDWVLDRIPGINKIRVDTERLQERLGILGEPMLIGLIIGLGMGILARMELQALLNMAIRLAAAMVLMPRMIALLMEGLVPIFQSARDWIMSRFPGYEFHIGLDAAVLVGKSEVLVTGMLMVPLTILLAVVLPGNRVLPFADLALLPFFAIWTVGVNRGNIFRGVIIAITICAVLLYGAGFVAPTITAMGQAAGFDAQTDGLYVSLEGGSITGSQFINLFVFALLNQNIWLIAAVAIIAVIVLLPIFRWITTRPRLASDLSTEEVQALAPTPSAD